MLKLLNTITFRIYDKIFIFLFLFCYIILNRYLKMNVVYTVHKIMFILNFPQQKYNIVSFTLTLFMKLETIENNKQ